MASYFYVFAAADSHIDFLRRHPNSVVNFIVGKGPDLGAPDTVPDNWPMSRLEPLGLTNAIHRNVDLYHWILNGRPDPVSGSGSLFQTWFAPEHSAIALDGESFAFKPDQVPDLVRLVKKVDVPSVMSAFSAWSKSQGRNYVPDVAACESFVEEFKTFGQKLESVMAKRFGLIWIPC